MKKLISAIGVATAFASPASAAGIIGSATFDTTITIGSAYAPTTIVHWGPLTLQFSGDPAGLLDSSITYPIAGPCSACLDYSISGRTASFFRLPAFHNYYEYRFSLTFDRDLGGDILNTANAQVVWGSMYVTGGGSGSHSVAEGLLVGGSVFLPEPESWALMVAGIGLVGAALRSQGCQALGAKARLG